MIPIKTFREHLLGSTNETYTNKIMEVLGDTDIVNAKMKQHIHGLTTPETIYIDLDGALNRWGEMGLAFIILHEFAHYSRIKTMGKEWYLKNQFNSKIDFYIDHHQFEEDFADRFARLTIKKVFGFDYESELTNRNYYTTTFEDMLRVTHEEIMESISNEEELITYLKGFIVDVRQ